jgi:polyribonucleotide nucleotidyltransferase
VFPYTIRVVSEITESNGSSSMASVCGGSLAMMDAGVVIKAPVAGIAMGLIGEGEKYAVLSDILGLEDHLGDMDFKVTGTSEGITALQMDNKLGGIPFEVLEQALAVTTLGTSKDEQRIEELEGQSWKSYMLHYNFPPYSVGEVRPVRGVGRREVGHGALGERGIEPVIPADTVFPYTIRIVSDILESNGSSSMATVCAGSLSLMDAGVPIKAPVAGIAMGLMKEGDRYAVLSDILGSEDHLGDMDFKVTGTREGITAFQMDIKIGGITFPIMEQALARARDGRLHILGVMEQCLAEPREDISAYAPRISIMQINPDKIREVIGPGGKVIKRITEETGAQIDIEDTGEIRIAAYSMESGKRAEEIIRGIVDDPEVGMVFKGKVRSIVSFGAFIEIVPGKDGLLHISEIDHKRTNRVEDVLQMGDEVEVKVIAVDREGKIKLSRKVLLTEPEVARH